MAARSGTVSDRYQLGLLALFAAVAVALGISPSYRDDWLIENLLVFATLAVLLASHRRFRLSDTSCTLLFAFLVLHEIGAHYTYAEVPYAEWLAAWTGIDVASKLGWSRNHYDRLIHFAYGLLMLLPAVELLRRVAPPAGIWRYVLPVTFILSHSAIYELIEGAAAFVFGGDLGTAYLGTQGDEWDAQKDMLCAGLGAVVGAILVRPGRS